VSGLALAVRLGSTAADPGQLLGLLVACYLGAWGLVFVLSRQDPTANAARFLACSASVGSVVLVFEAPALAGAVDYRVQFANPTAAWLRPENRPDPDLLYARRGLGRVRRTFQGDEIYHLRGAKPWALYRSDLRYDRDGFRNPPELGPADAVVIGDSFIEGAHVADPELMTARLSEALGRPVVNLGRTGYGPQQELVVLRRYGVARRPRTCVWAFYEGNDLDDADRYEADRAEFERLLSRERPPSAFDRSFTRNALLFVSRSWLRPEPRRPARRYAGRFDSRSAGAVPIYFASGDYRRVGIERTGVERIRSVLAEAHDVCRSHGVRLVVVFIPTKWRVYRDFCAFETDAACLRWGLDDLPGVVEEVVARVSGEVTFLDLTPRFRAQAAGGSLLYLPDDTHWSAEGHRVAARAVAEVVEGHPLASNAR
jgi:hypothetical protein